MVRIIVAAALALIVAFSAAAVAQQGARASRWQPDQFGPIVPTDTMWSIAGYYSRQQGVSLYEMMDSIVAANPRAFRDNRPDFMLTGFFLEIPELGEGQQAGSQAAKVAVEATQPQRTTTDTAANETATESANETASEPRSQAQTAEPVDTSVESEIAISVSELQALRSNLSDSIELIETLQGENNELQQRLAAVTRELNLLRARADEEQQASTEMELIAEELSSQEVTADTVVDEPTASSPTESSASDETRTEEAPIEQTTAAAATDAAPATEQGTQPQQVASKRNKKTWLDWLMKPMHLTIIGGLLIILLGSLAYALYVRRVNREIEEGGIATEPSQAGPHGGPDAEAPTAAAVVATASEASDEETNETLKSEQEEEVVSDDYAEVTDVDLDEYLREREGEPSSDNDQDVEAPTEATEHDDDPMSKEVDALLSMDFEQEEAAETAQEDKEEQEKVAEYRLPESDNDAADLDDEEKATRGELDEALDSFGGLRLDDSDQKAEDADADDEEYLSIESLMEEAETEASEEQEDPYDKDKLSDALGADERDNNAIDLSTEAMLDESKSPAAKLDLAQVYIDMGELDDARELLESIQGCGDEEAERDAAELLEKLAEQGGR